VQAGILKQAANRAGARRLIEFMLTPEGQKILRENGIPNFGQTKAQTQSGGN